MALSVLSVASEAVPFVKTGGLADVVGALPAALALHGVRVTTMLPGYPAVLKRLAAQAEEKAAQTAKAKPARAKAARAEAAKVEAPPVRTRRVKPAALVPLHVWDSLFGERAALLKGEIDGQPLLVLDCPALFARAGGPYGDDAGRDWHDNWRRFAAFGRAAADIAGGVVPGLAFDVIHAHDWQAAMALAYLRFAPPAGARTIPAVMTIHNMAFQGHFGAHIFAQMGLPPEAWAMNGVEYHGGVGFLKAGLEAAWAVTTVSPTYAHEISKPEYGMGLEGLIRSRGDRVRGIVNGIDAGAWNPAHDPAIVAPFTARSMARRVANKRALEAEFGLEAGDGPLFIVVSRLTWQKGMDVLGECVDHLVGLGGRLAVLGTGDSAIVGELQGAATRHPGRMALRVSYDEGLAHRMQAGGDAILVPSRFEPCGLTQLYALAYGCVPVVARTGGLADTVIDANFAALVAGTATGVMFSPVDYAGFSAAISRAIALYHDRETWSAIQRSGMRCDFSWARSAATYAALYRELVDRELVDRDLIDRENLAETA